MENKSHAFVAGVFTLILGVAVILALYIFGGNQGEFRQVMVVTQSNVVGLNPQAQVRYRGIRVGKVLDIRLDPKNISDILILMEVDQFVPLTEGTTARLSYQGITGIAQILLEDDGSNTTLLADDVGGKPPRIAMRSSLLEDLGQSLPDLLRQTEQFVQNANALLSEENRQSFGKTLANFEASSARIEGTLIQVEKLLSDGNVQAFSSTLKESSALVVDARQLVGELKQVSNRVDGMLVGLSSSSVDSLGPRIREMTIELTSTSRQLSRVLNLLETSPQSLLFGAPPVDPGPGEPGFGAPVPPAEPR